MEMKFKKERNDRQPVFLQVFHEKIMGFREYPYQISLNAKIERKAQKRKEAKQIKKEKNQNIFFIICTKKAVFYGG